MKKIYINSFYKVAGNTPEECAKKIAEKKTTAGLGNYPCQFISVIKVGKNEYKGLFYDHWSRRASANLIEVCEL